MQQLHSRQDVDAVLREPAAVLFKHSTRCPISAAAYNQLAAVDDGRPSAPVYIVDVNAQRDVSDYIAERLGAPHDSPQAFVLARGAPLWRASHYAIRARDIEAALAEAAAP
jgi:bacillithiol system protein YtxJ